ncbi:hypothetical protein Tco_0617679 [Tanacetum coccineum]
MLRYLKGQPKLGLWYPKDSPFDLVAYTDSDYAGASLDREVHNRRPEYVTALKLLWPSALDSKSSVDWTKHNEIDITPSRDSNEKKLIQMIKIHTDKNVADLLTKAFDEIASLKKRVKELERKRKSKTSGMKRLFKIGRPGQVVSFEDEGLDDQEDASKQERKIDDIDQDAEVTLVDETQRSAKPNIIVQESVQSTNTTTPSTIPKAKGIVFHEQEQAPTPIVSSQQPTQVKDKGKGKMVKEEPVKKMFKKELLKLDEELAFKLQAKEEEQARLAREKAEKVEEANISWDNVQAMIEADRLLAERLQAREQEELTDEKKARLFVKLLEKRKRYFAALKA